LFTGTTSILELFGGLRYNQGSLDPGAQTKPPGPGPAGECLLRGYGSPATFLRLLTT